MNLDISLLECLEAVVTEGSFDGAAQVLSITQSAVSQRIRSLEQQVGLPLLYRTRPVQPTPAAQPLLRFSRQVRLLAMETWPEVASSITQGHLRIAVNADSLETWVLPALRPWLEEHDVMLEFVVDDQTLTHARLRNGEVIGSIGSDPISAKGFRAILLGYMPYACVASPAFAEKYFPQGMTISTARKAPALVFNRRDKLQAEHLTRHLGWKEPRFPHHFVPGFTAYLQSALLGYGYGLSPLLQCQSMLDSGQLVDLTPTRRVDVPLYWHTWQLESELIGSLGKALLGGAAAVLNPTETSPRRKRRG